MIKDNDQIPVSADALEHGTMVEAVTIPKNVSTENDLDFEHLKSLGIKYIESLGGGLWTDFNVHDPGYTFLELLCYAITDLAHRLEMPIRDLVSSEDDLELANQFYRAEELLPSSVVTVLDYRKRFADIAGVRNVWMVAYDKKLHVNCRDSQIAYSPKMFGPLPKELKTSVDLLGLSKVYIDYDPDAVNENGETLKVSDINKEIRKVYNANRNLCEDLVEIAEIAKHPIGVCANIELDHEVDENKVHADILDAIEAYFTPELNRYSLKEMLDKGYRTDEIFEGPHSKKGFIDPQELEDAELRSEVRLSDIVQIIMAVDGVKLLKDITIKDCKKNKDGKDWLICLDPYTKPVLCGTTKSDDSESCCTVSVFNYYKGVLPVTYSTGKVDDLRKLNREAIQTRNDAAAADNALKLLRGTFRDPKETTTIQNELPDTYGIGPNGLPASATVERKSQAMQLKGYLSFFDQILATYFAHLGKVKDLLSINTGVTPTYFTQAIQDMKSMDNLMKDYPTSDDNLLAEKLIGDMDKNIQRRNEILDHLLARFAEQFSEFTFLMKELYGGAADEFVLRSKESFLAEYVKISRERGEGYNILGDAWDTDNTSGAEHRIARLTGVRNYFRRDLSKTFVKIREEKDHEGETVYRWEVRDDSGNKIIRSTEDYPSPSKAGEELYFTIFQLINIDEDALKDTLDKGIVDEQVIQNVQLTESPKGSWSFNVLNPEENPNNSDWIIARHGHLHKGEEKAKKALLDTLTFLKERFTEEGIFLVEHILLLPELDNDAAPLESFLPVCTDDCNTACCTADPYSFKVSVILPGYTQRFFDTDFRNYMELLIRKELPAHVVPKICWIGYRKGEVADKDNQMLRFEKAYEAYLNNLKYARTYNKTVKQSKLIDLNKVLSDLHTIYPTGKLHDCDGDQELEGKLILGRTNLGSY